MLQTNDGLLSQLREFTKALWGQLDPRSDWVRCTSVPENPIMILTLKPEVVANKRWSREDQEHVLQEAVDEVSCVLSPSKSMCSLHLQSLANGVLITRLKVAPRPLNGSPKEIGWESPPALKICVTIGLSKKDLEKAGTTIRHAITKVVVRKR